jgi:hypothetical protein
LAGHLFFIQPARPPLHADRSLLDARTIVREAAAAGGHPAGARLVRVARGLGVAPPAADVSTIQYEPAEGYVEAVPESSYEDDNLIPLVASTAAPRPAAEHVWDAHDRVWRRLSDHAIMHPAEAEALGLGTTQTTTTAAALATPATTGTAAADDTTGSPIISVSLALEKSLFWMSGRWFCYANSLFSRWCVSVEGQWILTGILGTTSVIGGGLNRVCIK